MRKPILALLLLQVFMAGCTKDENAASGGRTLVGTWAQMFVGNGSETNEFKADGTYLYLAERKSSSGKTLRSREEGTWKLDGKTLTMTRQSFEAGWYVGDRLDRDLSGSAKNPQTSVLDLEWLSSDRITLDDDAGSPIAFERQ